MAITPRDPNRIWLGGSGVGIKPTVDNQHAAKVAITPGMLIEPVNDGGVRKYQPHSTATGVAQPTFAEEQLEWNLGVDDAYGVNDLVKALIGRPGDTFWAIVPSGQTIVAGDRLASNGDGKLRKSDTNPVVLAMEAVTATADSRLRVEVI